MTTIHLVRHALHGLVGRELVGRRPGVPLSPEGVAQATRLRDRLAGESIARILSSPLQRAGETAALVAGPHGLNVEVADALTEIDCGEWTGASFDTLAGDPRWRAWNDERSRAAIPGGETMAAVRDRVAALVDGLARPDGGTVVLVSHADVIKAVVAGLIGLPLDWHHRIVVDPASITTLEMWGPGAGRLLRMNETVAP